MVLDFPDDDKGGMKTKTKRIQFTEKELRIIRSMATIAAGSQWGYEDYEGWSEKTSKPFDSMQKKLFILLDRKLAPKKNCVKA